MATPYWVILWEVYKYRNLWYFLGFETSKSKKKKCQTPELDVIEEIGESRHEFLMSSSRNIHWLKYAQIHEISIRKFLVIPEFSFTVF